MASNPSCRSTMQPLEDSLLHQHLRVAALRIPRSRPPISSPFGPVPSRPTRQDISNIIDEALAIIDDMDTPLDDDLLALSSNGTSSFSDSASRNQGPMQWNPTRPQRPTIDHTTYTKRSSHKNLGLAPPMKKRFHAHMSSRANKLTIV